MPTKKAPAKTKAVQKTVKVAAKKTEKAEEKTKPAKAAGSSSVTVYSLLGKETGEMILPKEVFLSEVNKALLSQAVRVYQNNQKGHFSNTKSRGEVHGSSRKIYKQKGTGRARHGSIRANIFVGGGISLGPKARNTVLDLPSKMKKAALISALSQKMSEKNILGLEGLEKASGKTKEVANALLKIGKKKVLIVGHDKFKNFERAAQNLPNAKFLTTSNLSVFDVISSRSLILTREAVEKLQQRLKAKDKKEVKVTEETKETK